MRIKVFGNAIGLAVREIEEWLEAEPKADIEQVDVTFEPLSAGAEKSWPVVFVVVYYELHSD